MLVRPFTPTRFFNAGSVCQSDAMTERHNVEIRPVQPDDHAQVLELAPRLTEGVANWRDPHATSCAVHGWVESSLGTASQQGHAVYVAIADGRVGGVVTVCERRHFTGQVDAYVGELAVAADLERRGIATQLMNAAETWAASRGLAFLTLETGAANNPARAFYAQRGYREEDIRLTKAIR
jgi:ribosomal protein S18 acetylase RimI-like enzyme